MRDLTQQQFDDKCRRYGFKPTGFMGYYTLPIEGRRISVSIHNAGKNRRRQLAYLLHWFTYYTRQADRIRHLRSSTIHTKANT